MKQQQITHPVGVYPHPFVPCITINGVELTNSQATVLRSAMFHAYLEQISGYDKLDTPRKIYRAKRELARSKEIVDLLRRR